ncbi:aldose epimerase family protein [Hymenobacter algoricola]|uniref:Aldose 1-epimerase n=1 Tax=Hymenobacter algoricola TaxID=486267 RepID=A0ABP7NED9_9BACT
MSTATVSAFGQLTTGDGVRLYTLTNARGLRAAISNYGGTLTSLLVPDRSGTLGNVVLGFEALSDYQSPPYLQANPYFGALIGRYGNRIAHGRFALDGRQYQLAQNNGPSHLHGGRQGFDKVVWAAETGSGPDGATLTLTYHSRAGEEGYPGNLDVTVVYTLTDDNALRIAYSAVSDQATPLNLTNHAYFNLNHDAGTDILGHELTLRAGRYTVVDDTLIPTGELRAVADTPFDFRTPHPIGARLSQVPGGYDHNWVLDAAPGPVAATVYEPVSGRTLHVVTDQPGVQFYTGNFLDGTLTGRHGVRYGKHAGFCLETQHFPDSPNQPAFPSTILRPGHTYQTTTEYRFGVQGQLRG